MNNWVILILLLVSVSGYSTSFTNCSCGSNDANAVECLNTLNMSLGFDCNSMPNPFENIDLNPDPQPSFVDLDNDGDMDLLVGSDGQLFYYENHNGSYTESDAVSSAFLPNVSFLDMSVSLSDLDGDGDQDLSIVGNQAYNKYFYWNTGTKTQSVFTLAGSGGTPHSPIERLELEDLDGGVMIGYADASISWVDLDADNDYDAVVGGKLGWFQYYENIGTRYSPHLKRRTGVDNPFDGFRVNGEDEGNGIMQYESAPYLVDWDSDGDFDMFSSNQIAGVQYYENVGNYRNPDYRERTGLANPLDDAFLAEDAHIVITDLDCDGDWDLIYGHGDVPASSQIAICDLDDEVKFLNSSRVLDLPEYKVCMGTGKIDLENGRPADGVYTGSGVSGSFFDPAVAGVGIHSVTYSYDNENGCEILSRAYITVNSLPTVELVLEKDEICINQGLLELSEGLPMDGMFSGVGILDGNGQFDPAIAGVGNHIITYTFIDDNGCENSASDDISVLAENNGLCDLNTSLELNITNILTTNSYCDENNGSITFSFDDHPNVNQIQFSFDGGVTWAPPVSDNIGSMTIDNIAAGQYNLWVRESGGGSEQDLGSAIIEYIEGVDVFLNLRGVTTCSDNSEFILEGGRPAGGSYSGPGVQDNIFNANISGVGSHTITYTYIDTNGCIGNDESTLTVHDAPVDQVVDLLICEEDLPHLWNGIAISETGSYKLTSFDANGCKFNETLELTVLAKSIETIDIEINEADLPFIWNGIEIYKEGQYENSIVDPNGCTMTEVLNFVILNTSSTKEHIAVTGVYPNPAKEQFTVESSEQLDLVMFDAIGNQILTRKILEGSNQVHTLGVTDGVYMLRLSNGKNAQTHMIVIQN